jgi:hypothetical protein
MLTDDTAMPDVRAQVRQLWLSAVLDGVSGTFTEAGGDSLSGLRLIGAVYKSVHIRVAWDVLNTAADVDDFADRVARMAAESG